MFKLRFMRKNRYGNKTSDDIQQQASLALIEGHSQSQSTEVLQDDEDRQTNETAGKSDADAEAEADAKSDERAEGGEAETTAFTISFNHSLVTETPEKLLPSGADNGSAGQRQPPHPAISSDSPTATATAAAVVAQKTQQQTKRDLKKESLEAKRERKAAKTLAIITGAFVVCWLPFFIMALLMPLCDACYISDHLASFFLWLGYFNSTLNPVIYTVFSPEFRQAFKRILCGPSHGRNHPRKLR